MVCFFGGGGGGGGVCFGVLSRLGFFPPKKLPGLTPGRKTVERQLEAGLLKDGGEDRLMAVRDVQNGRPGRCSSVHLATTLAACSPQVSKWHEACARVMLLVGCLAEDKADGILQGNKNLQSIPR